MPRVNKGLIALDIDGTITGENHLITDEVVDFLTQCYQEGWWIHLTTGRTFMFAEESIEKFNIPFDLGVGNGSDLIAMPTKESIEKTYLDPYVLKRLEEIYEGIPEDFLVYANYEAGDYCHIRPGRYSDELLAHLDTLRNLAAVKWHECEEFVFDKGFDCPIIKCFGTEENIDRVYEEIKNDEKLTVSRITDVIDPKYRVLLITHPEANKGIAAGKIQKLRGCKYLISGGNDFNDMPLFEVADVALTVSDAPEELQKAADFVCRPSKENGLIEGIQKAIKRLEPLVSD